MSDQKTDSDIFVLERIAALLQSGEQASRVVDMIHTEVADLALRKEALSILKLSSRTGAAAVSALQQLANGWRASEELARKIDSEFAAPRATFRLVISLPLVVLIFGACLGIPVFQVLIENRFAQLSAVLGLLLLWFGHRWSRRLLISAKPKPEAVSQQLERLASALRCGLGFSLAAREVGLPLDLEAQLTTERKLARERGAPIADLVLLRAQAIRDRHAHESLRQVRELGVRLMTPLGATVLPALLFLLVIPMALSLGRGTQPLI